MPSVDSDLSGTIYLVVLCGHWAQEYLSRDAGRLFEVLEAIFEIKLLQLKKSLQCTRFSISADRVGEYLKALNYLGNCRNCIASNETGRC